MAGLDASSNERHQLLLRSITKQKNGDTTVGYNSLLGKPGAAS